MTLLQPKFASAANALMCISVKQNVFHLFLNVSSEMSVDREMRIVWQAVPHSWSTDREAVVMVTFLHPK